MTVMNESFQLKLRLNENIASAFKEAIEGKRDVPDGVKKCTEEGYLAGLDELEWLHANKKGVSHFHELISGCELELPSPVIPPRNPELEARIQKLKAEQEEREYKKMTKNVDNIRIKQPDETIGYQLRQINRQLIAVLQFIFSVAAGFAFGFIGIELLVGNLEFGFRLLLGVIFALIIALAEIYFLAKKLAEDDEPPTPIKVHKLHKD